MRVEESEIGNFNDGRVNGESWQVPCEIMNKEGRSSSVHVHLSAESAGVIGKKVKEVQTQGQGRREGALTNTPSDSDLSGHNLKR